MKMKSDNVVVRTIINMGIEVFHCYGEKLKINAIKNSKWIKVMS